MTRLDEEPMLVPVGTLLGTVSDDALDLARWCLVEASTRSVTVTRAECKRARGSLERLRKLIGRTSGESDLVGIVLDAIAFLDLADDTTRQVA